METIPINTAGAGKLYALPDAQVDNLAALVWLLTSQPSLERPKAVKILLVTCLFIAIPLVSLSPYATWAVLFSFLTVYGLFRMLDLNIHKDYFENLRLTYRHSLIYLSDDAVEMRIPAINMLMGAPLAKLQYVVFDALILLQPLAPKPPLKAGKTTFYLPFATPEEKRLLLTRLEEAGARRNDDFMNAGAVPFNQFEWHRRKHLVKIALFLIALFLVGTVKVTSEGQVYNLGTIFNPYTGVNSADQPKE